MIMTYRTHFQVPHRQGLQVSAHYPFGHQRGPHRLSILPYPIKCHRLQQLLLLPRSCPGTVHSSQTLGTVQTRQHPFQWSQDNLRRPLRKALGPDFQDRTTFRSAIHSLLLKGKPSHQTCSVPPSSLPRWLAAATVGTVEWIHP